MTRRFIANQPAYNKKVLAYHYRRGRSNRNRFFIPAESFAQIHAAIFTERGYQFSCAGIYFKYNRALRYRWSVDLSFLPVTYSAVHVYTAPVPCFVVNGISGIKHPIFLFLLLHPAQIISSCEYPCIEVLSIIIVLDSTGPNLCCRCARYGRSMPFQADLRLPVSTWSRSEYLRLA